MTKEQALQQWRTMTPRQPMMPHFRPLPYKASGSKFGACGIRIDGPPAFVEAVLSNLQELLAGEAVETRLQLSRAPAATGFKAAPNAEGEAEVCYIRLWERGNEGKMLAAYTEAAKARQAARQAQPQA